MAYATAEELARILKINEATYSDQLDECLDAATLEIDREIDLGLDDDDQPITLTDPEELALAAQVNLERAVEHWHARAVAFGIVGLETEAPVRLARDTWERHANKLAPLKQTWGFA